jgi:hypothetical protein
MNRRKLFIHIGFNKCGSTYLQHNFILNRNKFDLDNVFYPIFTNTNELKIRGNADFLGIFFSINNKLQNKLEILNSTSNNLINIFSSKENTNKHILFSSEYLKLDNIQGFEKFYNLAKNFFFEINFIAIYRSIYEHAYSAYLQKHKYVENDIKKNYSLISQARVTVKRMSLFPYQKYQKYKKVNFLFIPLDSNLYKNFLKVINVRLHEDLSNKNINKSLTINSTLILKKIRKLTNINFVKKCRFFLEGNFNDPDRLSPKNINAIDELLKNKLLINDSKNIVSKKKFKIEVKSYNLKIYLKIINFLSKDKQLFIDFYNKNKLNEHNLEYLLCLFIVADYFLLINIKKELKNKISVFKKIPQIENLQEYYKKINILKL